LFKIKIRVPVLVLLVLWASGYIHVQGVQLPAAGAAAPVFDYTPLPECLVFSAPIVYLSVYAQYQQASVPPID